MLPHSHPGDQGVAWVTHLAVAAAAVSGAGLVSGAGPGMPAQGQLEDGSGPPVHMKDM